MATHATLSLYELMADLLERDPEWQTLGKPLDHTMIHAYTGSVDTAFYMRFDQGHLTDLRELDDPSEQPADFVLTGTAETWRRIFSKVPKTRASGFHFALSTGTIRYTGPFMTTYLEHSRAWEHLLDLVGGADIGGSDT